MTTTRDLITPEEMARLRRKRPGAQFLAIDLHDMVWWIDPDTCTDIANAIFCKREEFLAVLVHSGLLTEIESVWDDGEVLKSWAPGPAW